jgi:cellulose biosynthesis protein BcsQ
VSRILVAGGAGSTDVSSTVAANLAVAMATIAAPVELHDLAPGAEAARALAGAPAVASDVERRLLVMAGPRLAWRTEPAHEETPRDPLDAAEGGREIAPAAPDVPVVIVRVSGAADALTAAARTADLVLVPVDASPRSLEGLDEVVVLLSSSALAPAPLLRVVVSRLLPRAVDRWALVERVTERSGGALYGVTVPLGRGSATAAARADGVPATMYSTGGRAAAAYRSLARLVLADVAAGARPGR